LPPISRRILHNAIILTYPLQFFKNNNQKIQFSYTVPSFVREFDFVFRILPSRSNVYKPYIFNSIMKNGTEAVLGALHSVPFCFLFSELNSQSYFNERYVIAIVILAHYTVEAESVIAYPLGVYI